MRVAITTLLLLAGCATSGDVAAADEAELAAELANRRAGEPVDCIDVRASQSLVPVAADTVILRDFGTIWVNELESACPGLRPTSTLIVEPSLAGRYCRNDLIRPLDPGSRIAGATCRLGDFTPYSERRRR